MTRAVSPLAILSWTSTGTLSLVRLPVSTLTLPTAVGDCLAVSAGRQLASQLKGGRAADSTRENFIGQHG